MSAGPALAQARAWLATARNADGGWGYQPGSPSRPEPTLLAAAAGMPLPSPWLAAHELGWVGLLLPAVAWPSDRPLSQKWIERILNAHGKTAPDVPWYDAGIPGWSWHPDTGPWVEPTCYAILSLLRGGAGAARVAEGRRMLVARQCHDGGWNFGTPRVFDQRLDGGFSETGWALLALPPGPVAERGLAFLAGALAAPSTLALALAALATHKHGRDAWAYASALAPRLGPEGFRRRVDWTALAVMAMAAVEEGTHAFG